MWLETQTIRSLSASLAKAWAAKIRLK